MIRLAVLLSFSVLATAQSPVELVREKRYAEAHKAMTGVAEPAEPRQKVGFHRLKAAIASGLGEHARAADEMVAALALAPEDPGLLLATAVAELQAARLDSALKHASKVGSAAGWATVGDIQERRKEYLAAAQAYQRAVELAPDIEAYRLALALELARHAAFDAAAAVLEQAAPLFPKSSKIRTLLGITYHVLPDAARAQSAMLDAIAVDPQAEPAYRYLAGFVLDASAEPAPRVVEALCSWDKIVCAALKLRVDAKDAASLATLAAAEGPIAKCEVARAYERLERWTAARAPMESCVRLEPVPQNHYRLGRLYQRLGQSALAAREMGLYRETTRKLSEDAARRERAVRAFEVVTR